MPSTQDYTLIQFMRGGKYAVETVVPKAGEPLVDSDSNTLYIGDNREFRGIPINTVTAVKVESPANLDDQKTWGRYYIDGKVIGLPEGVELYGKFFLTVQGSTATDARSLWQKLDILTGDFQDQSFIRSSTDGGFSWTSWKRSNNGSNVYFDPYGNGNIERNPISDLASYVLSSQNYIDNIIGGPEDSDDHAGLLFVFRKDLVSPYIYQELIILDSPENSGRVYARFSVDGNKTWDEPGYPWRRITVEEGTLTKKGIVKLSSSVNSPSESTAATSKAVKTAYDLANYVDSKKFVVYTDSLPDQVPDGLVEGGIIIVG